MVIYIYAYNMWNFIPSEVYYLMEVACDTQREEVFGPVAPLIRFKTDEEAIKMANDTEFGTSHSLFYNVSQFYHNLV